VHASEAGGGAVKRVVRLIAALFVVWLAVVFVLGFIFAGRTGRSVATRVGTSLAATAKFDDASLGLVRGTFSLENLSVRREDLIGKLTLDVGTIDCDLLPLGVAIVDSTCGPLEVRDVKLEVSTTALFDLKVEKTKPFKADRVIVDNADLVFMPSAFLPNLGRVHIAIEHAEAGRTNFKSPLSFLFNLEELRARLELPAGIEIRLIYTPGKLVAQGSIFGSTPVEIPIELPKPSDADDARAEIVKLVTFGKDLAKRLVRQKAEDWLQKKLPIP
jgi:hypothetical protein